MAIKMYPKVTVFKLTRGFNAGQYMVEWGNPHGKVGDKVFTTKRAADAYAKRRGR